MSNTVIDESGIAQYLDPTLTTSRLGSLLSGTGRNHVVHVEVTSEDLTTSSMPLLNIRVNIGNNKLGKYYTCNNFRLENELAEMLMPVLDEIVGEMNYTIIRNRDKYSEWSLTIRFSQNVYLSDFVKSIHYLINREFTRNKYRRRFMGGWSELARKYPTPSDGITELFRIWQQACDQIKYKYDFNNLI